MRATMIAIVLLIGPATAAELDVKTLAGLPPEILYGQSKPDATDLTKFGRYGDAYYQRRWARMCKGSARYEAMREAWDLGKRQPC